ncbi:SOS response-associated peptidase [Sorangium sp. So ce375]|uniref:SOS response-associated peptidase n=1 Tax=Sorangium sp. So ce375 TaxID=3133306 RepID=UPI003F5C7714
MCARFTLTLPDFATLAAMLEASLGGGRSRSGPARSIAADPEIAAMFRPRFNIAPATVHPVLRARGGQRALVAATWGFVGRFASGSAGPSLLANARAESARTKPTFRDAFASSRCVVPADGFYEWSGPKGARRPTWFHPAGGGLLRLAGLCQPAKAPDTGGLDLRFTILTTEANADVAPVHDRMPVLLDPEDVDLWLGLGGGADADRAEALLRPAPRGALAARPVSPRVNSVAHDDPALLHEIAAEHAATKAAPPKAGGTLPLFDLGDGARPAAPSGRSSRR